MEDFKLLLQRAKQDDQAAVTELVNRYKSYMIKLSIVGERFDDDLFQSLVLTFVYCIHKFTVQ